MSKRFCLQGYSMGTLRRAINIAETTQRGTLLQVKKRREAPVNIPVFSTSYSLEFKLIRNIVESQIFIL